MRARYSADIAGTIASITSAVSAGVGDAVVVSGVAAASIGTATGSTAGTAAVLPQLGHLTSHTNRNHYAGVGGVREEGRLVFLKQHHFLLARGCPGAVSRRQSIPGGGGVLSHTTTPAMAKLNTLPLLSGIIYHFSPSTAKLAASLAAYLPIF